MSPPSATVLSPESLNLSHRDQDHHEPDGVDAHTSSPFSDTVNVKTHSDRDSAHTEDDGGQRPDHSGDEGGSDQDHDNDDEVSEVVTRHGKRKRPISVSYVRLMFWFLGPIFYFLFSIQVNASVRLLLLSILVFFVSCRLEGTHVYSLRWRRGDARVWLSFAPFPQIFPCHRYHPMALASFYPGFLPRIPTPALLRLLGSHIPVFIPS